MEPTQDPKKVAITLRIIWGALLAGQCRCIARGSYTRVLPVSWRDRTRHMLWDSALSKPSWPIEVPSTVPGRPLLHC